MAQTIRNVMLIGASGNVGSPILQGLLASKAFNVTILSRATSSAAFPTGTTVKKVDYEDEAALVEAFTGQDAVISTLTAQFVASQTKLIDAAAKAGVKRFIPSHFGSDVTNPKVLEFAPFLKGKVDITNYLKSKEDTGMTWTSLINGYFFDWGMKVGFLGFDTKAHSAVLFDPEAPTASTGTTLKKVGQAVAGILLHPKETENRYVHISSFTPTRAEVLAAFEKITGSKWTTSNKSTFDLQKDGQEKLAKGDHTGVYDLIVAALYRRGVGSDFGLEKNDNQLLDLPEENLHDVLTEILEAV